LALSERWAFRSPAPTTNTAPASTRSISCTSARSKPPITWLTLRTVAKHVAARFGLEATFMPKPIEDSAGSGLHVDFRLGENGDDTMLYVIGGLLAP